MSTPVGGECAIQTTVMRTPIRPYLKWAGGKRQLLSHLRNYVPKQFHTYFEPFLGAGAVLFDLQPDCAVVNDINEELINAYRTIHTDVHALIQDLSKHKNEMDYFYQVRDMDRTDLFTQLSPVERASRLIYLNKTCFNGLFRVNRHGQFNVPFGRYKNPKIVDEPVLLAIHEYLNRSHIRILQEDFERAVAGAKQGDFVYLDPPYDPVSSTSSFTGYSTAGFYRDSQYRLKRVFDDLHARGCKVLLSNSATPFVLDLYKQYRIVTIAAKRAINSNAKRRGNVREVLVMNYTNEK